MASNDAEARTSAHERRDELWRLLGPWYAKVKRSLPWRDTHDPYAVLVSEVMLQQTQVATAIPYFERFMARFPTAQDLAGAPIDDVLHQWQGLGYYTRARSLQEAAKLIVDRFDGAVPCDQGSLVALPGVGRYTAGAVASIAFNQPVPILDGNVMRVLTRLFALGGDPKSGPTNRLLWSLAEALIPTDDARTFNVALMELGALVCRPTKPECGSCPLARMCEVLSTNTVDRYPELPRRRPTVFEEHVAVLVKRDGAFILTQRPRNVTWAGLWELPRVRRVEGEPLPDAARRAAAQVCAVDAAIGLPFGTIRHSVTHHRIRLHGFHAEWLFGEPEPTDCAAVDWVAPDTISGYALSSPQRKLLDGLRTAERQNRLF